VVLLELGLGHLESKSRKRELQDAVESGAVDKEKTREQFSEIKGMAIKTRAVTVQNSIKTPVNRTKIRKAESSEDTKSEGSVSCPTACFKRAKPLHQSLQW
jgi:hypothetical protein